MRRLLTWSAALLVGGLLGPLPVAQAGPDVVGPMVGHTTSTSALIWAYAGRQRLGIYYRRADEPKGSGRTVPMPPYSVGPGMCRVRLTGLQPRTKYIFAPSINGRVVDDRVGSFTTAPAEGAPARFRVAFTSCMKPDHDTHHSFVTLRKQEPDLLLLLGDNVYSDSTNRGRIWQHHVDMRGVPTFAALLRLMPTLAIWDDHDFAGDDSDGTAPGKDGSLRAFQELFPNPSFGLPDVPGVFFRFQWANVDFFMLDVRYHRSPNRAPDGPAKTMLGPRQLRWLVEGLRTSKAPFKVLVSGSTIEEKDHDCWRSFGHELRRLYGAIRQHRISGVVLLSGDLHRSIVKVHPATKTGFYDLVEVISSGIAVGGPMNFATLDFDTTLDDPTMTARIVERNGRVSKEHVVRLSSLR